jgi:hypothetical protein
MVQNNINGNLCVKIKEWDKIKMRNVHQEKKVEKPTTILADYK